VPLSFTVSLSGPQETPDDTQVTEPTVGSAGEAVPIAEGDPAYRALFLDSPSPMWIFDVGTFEILDVNEAAIRLYGYSRAEFTSLSIRDIRPAEDVPRLERVAAQAGTGSYDAGEWRHITADGTQIDVRVLAHAVRFRERDAKLVRVEDITTRKRAEAQLDLLGSALHAAANAIVITNRQGVIEWVNPAFTRMTGYAAAEAIGRNPGDLLRSGEHDAAFYADLWTTVLEGRVWRGQLVNRRKDGTLYHEEQTITPVLDPGGTVTHFIAVKEEVTARLAAEEALRRSEGRYRTLFDGVPVGLFRTTPAGEFIDANEALVRLLACDSRADLVGRSAVDFYEDPSARDRLIELIATTDQAHGLDVRLRRADGNRIWARLNVVAERDEHGRVICHEGAVDDVTDRRLNEDRLRFQAQLLGAVGDAVIATDTAGRIEYWNHRAEEMFGWAAYEVLGRDIIAVTVPADHRQVATALFERVLAGETWSGEFEAWRSDGNTVHAFVTDSPIYDQEGRVIGVVGVSRDLTAQRSLEHQLRHAQKMEAVGRLAGGIAHDFNNVLTAIHGHTQFLLDALADTKLLDDARVIQRSAERASQLTQQLLAFSRKQIRQPRVIDLGETVRDVESLLRPLLGEDIMLSIALPARRGRIEADAGQLEQVIVNLAVNARDAMPDGGMLTITVGHAEHADFGEIVADPVQPGSYMFIEVADTGTGMDLDTVDHLFEPFFTTKLPGKGTGLGLSTVYGIVKQSGGHMSVMTKPGEGSAFRAYFPRVEQPVTETPPSGSGRPPGSNGELVVVVEDEDGVRVLVRRILEGAGYRVRDFVSPVDALNAFGPMADDSAIDLILTDVVMPELSGVDLAERLLELQPETPVIFMSGYAENEAIRRGMVDDRHRFIGKPFTPAELLDLVAEVLQVHT
jgi:two-component system, cell cycle sensor histidine kinase and response regulator CckA